MSGRATGHGTATRWRRVKSTVVLLLLGSFFGAPASRISGKLGQSLVLGLRHGHSFWSSPIARARRRRLCLPQHRLGLAFVRLLSSVYIGSIIARRLLRGIYNRGRPRYETICRALVDTLLGQCRTLVCCPCILNQRVRRLHWVSSCSCQRRPCGSCSSSSRACAKVRTGAVGVHRFQTSARMV